MYLFGFGNKHQHNEELKYNVFNYFDIDVSEDQFIVFEFLNVLVDFSSFTPETFLLSYKLNEIFLTRIFQKLMNRKCNLFNF